MNDHEATTYGLPTGSGSMEDGLFMTSTPTSTQAFPGQNYVPRRSSTKDKDSKHRRRSTSNNKSPTLMMTRNSNGGGSNKSNTSRETDNSSPNNNSSSILEQRGNKYVLPPAPSAIVEQEALLLTSSANMMGSDDPLALASGEVWNDEMEDEMDEIEMREEKRRNFDAFGETEETSLFKKRLRSCQHYIIPAFFFFLFLGGVVAIILYLSGGFATSNNSKQTNKTIQTVVPAPESLDLMCAPDAKLGTDRLEIPALCQDFCLKSECCWNPNGAYVCTSESQVNCQGYMTECGTWQKKQAEEPPLEMENPNGSLDYNNPQIVPLFPAGLQTACVRTAFQVSVDCRQGCDDAACCWDHHANQLCTADSIHNCGDYKEVCSFLNDLLLPDNTEEDPTGDTTEGDTIDLGDFPYPPAPSGLDIYCDPSEVESVSLHICTDKCAQAECCWKNGVTSCVELYPPDACYPYTFACDILNGLDTAPGNINDITTEEAPQGTETSTTENVPQAPSDLATTCSKDRITDPETGGESLIVCEQECVKASCCWQPNAAFPCPDNERCSAYTGPCQIFVSLFDKPKDYDPADETLAPIVVTDVPPAPQSINMNCNPDVLKANIDMGKFIVECERECLMGACCWKKNHPTICPDANECSAYMTPCGDNLVTALLTLESGGAVGTTQTQSNAAAVVVTPAPTPLPPVVETNVPAAPQDLTMMCNKDVLTLDVSNGAFIVQCEKECLEAACCWKEGHATICPDAPECDNYMEPCKEHLVPVLAAMENPEDFPAESEPEPEDNGDSTIPEVPTDMVLRCSVNNLRYNPDGRGLCESICNQAECCWNSEVESCTSDDNCVSLSIYRGLNESSSENCSFSGRSSSFFLRWV
jgi:hypothetical protein